LVGFFKEMTITLYMGKSVNQIAISWRAWLQLALNSGVNRIGRAEAVCPTIKKMRLSHHSNGSWNPGKLLMTRMLLDSIWRWNDEVWGIFTNIGQTLKPRFPGEWRSLHRKTLRKEAKSEI
jgi:hypothetical protein